MNRIHIENFEIESEKFDHFAAGDGEIYFDYCDGEFLTRTNLEEAFVVNHITSEQEKVDYMNEFSICKSYNELDSMLDDDTDGDYDLTSLRIKDTVVMTIARRW